MSTEDTGIWRAAVEHRLDEGAKRMDALEVGQKALDRGQLEIIRQQGILLGRMDSQDTAIRENTEVTKIIRDAVTVTKVGSSFLEWFGKVWPGLVAIGAIALWLYKGAPL